MEALKSRVSLSPPSSAHLRLRSSKNLRSLKLSSKPCASLLVKFDPSTATRASSIFDELTKDLITTTATISSMVTFLVTLQRSLPPQFNQLLDGYKHSVTKRCLSRFDTVKVHVNQGFGVDQLYPSVQRYLSKWALDSDSACIVARHSPASSSSSVNFSLALKHEVHDTYRNRVVTWSHCYAEDDDHRRGFYVLTVNKRDKGMVPEYLDFVLREGLKLQRADEEKELFRNWDTRWHGITFKPRSRWETIAMDPAQKDLLKRDLDVFMDGQEYYARVGRAWKRGYVLYGPPGGGKSSLVGAIANYTGYDVYDLELTKVSCNASLKELLLGVKDRSIVVIEDIDCSMKLENRKAKAQKDDNSMVTLSGILNLIDGIWSSCGSERIFILTTNYIDRLDPALLRPGRMDMKILMSYCSFEMFKSLSSTYLGLTHHQLYPEIEKLLQSAKIMPAELIEIFLEHQNAPLEGLIQKLKDGHGQVLDGGCCRELLE